MIRIPEHIGVYKSMLEMAACRGDLPSARLAIDYILLKDSGKSIVLDCANKILLNQYAINWSLVPDDDISMIAGSIIFYMKSGLELNRSVQGLTLLYFNNPEHRLCKDFMLWLRDNPTSNISRISSAKTLITYKAHEYLEHTGILTYDCSDLIPDYSTQVNTIEYPLNINPDYFLGEYSWTRECVETYFRVSGYNLDIAAIINTFELNKTIKNISNSDYWTAAKQALFLDPEDMENRWETVLKPKAMELITSLTQLRLPMPTNG